MLSNYDAWKLRSPDDEFESWDEYDPSEPNDCAHDDYDFDPLTGRATCYCGESWYMSEEEMQRRFRVEEEFERQQRRQHRPWNRFKAWIARHWLRWRMRHNHDIDDEIPF